MRRKHGDKWYHSLPPAAALEMLDRRLTTLQALKNKCAAEHSSLIADASPNEPREEPLKGKYLALLNGLTVGVGMYFVTRIMRQDRIDACLQQERKRQYLSQRGREL